MHSTGGEKVVTATIIAYELTPALRVQEPLPNEEQQCI